MTNTTFNAIAALVRADASVNEAQRATLLQNLHVHEANGPGASGMRLLRLGDAAARLSVSRRTVTNLCRQGILRPLRLPGRRRALGIPERELERLLESGAPVARRRRRIA